MKILCVFLVSAFVFSPCSSLAKGPQTVDDLAELMENNRVRRVEELTRLLPTGILQAPIFFYDPRDGGYGATPEMPRVILRSSSPNLMFSFAGNPNAKKYHRLEVIERDPKTFRYSFHQFDFDPRGISKPKLVRNAVTCSRCHEGLPIWDSDLLWPGAFGTFARYDRQTVSDEAMKVEFRWWYNFKNIAAQNPRYRVLAEKDPNFQFISLEDLGRRNSEFTHLLLTANAKRIARHVVRAANFLDFADALLEATRLQLNEDYTRIETLQSIEINQDLFRASRDHIFNRLDNYLERRLKRAELLFGTQIPRSRFNRTHELLYQNNVNSIALMQYIFDKFEVGIHLGNESLTFERETYSFFGPHNNLSSVLNNICEAMLETR